MCGSCAKKREAKAFVFTCHTGTRPNARSIWIELVAAVKVFEIEELKESQPAACGQRPCEGVAAVPGGARSLGTVLRRLSLRNVTERYNESEESPPPRASARGGVSSRPRVYAHHPHAGRHRKP